jgi:macrolide-specific efflux system membrane fusion protein
VSAISAVPATSTSGTTTYRVIIGLDDASGSLHDGATGAVAIVTNAAKAALVVPSSAVHTTGTRHTVTVALGGSRTQTVSVGVGVQGATTIQITRGLAAGQRVVLADLAKALPSSATSTQAGQQANRAGANGPVGFGGPPSGFGGNAGR